MDTDNNNNVKFESTKRCLFGKPNVEDTKNLMDESYESDKKRFRDRYGVDIENLENVCHNIEKEEIKSDPRRGKVRRCMKRVAGERRAFRSCNKQFKLTGRCTYSYLKKCVKCMLL